MGVRRFIDATMDRATQDIRGDLSADEVLKAQDELYIKLEFEAARPCLLDATEGNVVTAKTGGGTKI